MTERVKKLFRGHPKLIRDFNYFLPQEHKIQQVSFPTEAPLTFHATHTLSDTRARADQTIPTASLHARTALAQAGCMHGSESRTAVPVLWAVGTA